MAGATWDMHTSGELTGQLVRPLRYTDTPEDAIRVKAYLQLATVLGKHRLAPSEGLDRQRLLDPSTSDQELAAWVRELLLRVEGVVDFEQGPEVTTVDLELQISVVCVTDTGGTFTLGA